MDGGSIGGTLFVVLLILKLAGVITWSWVWVTSPLWIDAAATVALFLILALFGVSVSVFFGAVSRRNRARRSRNYL